jgi:hypothetical protein
VVRYEPANSLETSRFSGVRTFMRLPNVQDLHNAEVAIVGALFDTGASFRGSLRSGGHKERLSPPQALQPFARHLDGAAVSR